MAVSYKKAIEWIVENDDTEWAKDPKGYMSVTAVMVADIYGKEDHKVRRDIVRALNDRERK
jgi:hypothetical protein